MPGLIHAGGQTRVCAPAACVMAGLRFCVLAVIALLSLSQTVDGQCTAFSSFPESVAVITGTNICFLCDYPGQEDEAWSTTCAVDQDNMCSCYLNNNISSGLELCFNNIQSDCTGNYTCNVSVQSVTCTAGPTEIVATPERFIEQPANIVAVQGNTVSFNCALLSGNSILWQYTSNTTTTFINATTPPSNYVLGTGNTLIIDGVLSDNAGMYRCAYEVQEGVYLYSDYGELDYLGEGVKLGFQVTSYSLEEGGSAQVCITFSGDIPDGYIIDSTVQSYAITAESATDYSAVNFTLSLVAAPNHNCVEPVPINTVQDSLVEDAEQFSLSLTSTSFIVDISNSSLLVTIQNNDYVTLSIAQASYTVEEGTELSVCLTYSGGDLNGMTVTYNATTVDGTAAVSRNDYNPVNTDQEISSVTNTSCVDVISIMINDDLIPETQQQFTIEIVSAETFVNITRESATIYIEDNDNLTIQFSQASYAFSESAGSSHVVSIVYDTRPEDFDINYSVSSVSGTATGSEDYVAIDTNLTITESSGLSDVVSVFLINDRNVEGNETFSLQLSTSSPSTELATVTATIVIIDDDRRVDIQFSQTTYTVNEYDGTIEVCVTANEMTQQSSAEPVGISVSTNPGSASDGSDYSQDASSIQLSSGSSQACTSLTIQQDNVFEGTETLELVFTNLDSNIIFNADSDNDSFSEIQTQITILDNSGFDDAPISLSLSLGSEPALFNCSSTESGVSLTFLVDGQDVDSLDSSFGISAQIYSDETMTVGNLTVPVTVENNNTEIECRLNRDGSISTSSPAMLTVTDFSGFVVGFEMSEYAVDEDFGSVQVCVDIVLRNAMEGQEATITITSMDGTATASGNSADYEMYSQDVTVTAAEIEEMAYCLDLALFGDEVVEGTEEFSLTITTASGPVEYESNRNATITLEDNDYFTIVWDSPSYEVGEGDGITQSICATASGTLQENLVLEISVLTTDGTATGGQDYVSVSQSNGAGPSFEEVGQFCQVVVIISDNIVDGNETFLLALETDQDFVQLDSPNTTITIIDDDRIGVSFEQSFYAFTEDQSSTSLSVFFDKEPQGFSANVYITSSSGTASDSVDYLTVDETLVLSQGGSLSRTISLSLVDDRIVEAENETFSLILTSDNYFVVISSPSTTITINDNDRRVDIDFAQSAYTFNEYDGTVEVCAITLNQMTYNFDVGFSVSVEDVETTVGVDYISNVFSLSLPAGETSVCSVGMLIEDDDFEGTESFYLVLGNSDPSIIFNANSDNDSTSEIRTQIYILDNSGFIETPVSVSASLGSESVEFNCSASISLTFLIDGEALSSLPLSRGIYITGSEMSVMVHGVLTVPVIEENNNTEVVCQLTGGQQVSTSPPAVLNITAFSGFVVGFEMTEYDAEEESGTLMVCLLVEYRNIMESTQATLNVYTLDGTATSLDAMDYYNLSSQIISLDSEADNTLQCVNLTLVGDELAEGAEYFVVSVAAVSGPVQITDANTTVKILDNDYYIISWEASSYAIAEDDSSALIICAVAQGTIQDNLMLDLSILTYDGTATEGLDYTSSFGFEEAGQFCQQVSISSDSLVEGNEHFILGLVTDQEFVQLTTANTTITIEDSDVFAAFFEQTSYTVRETAGTLSVCLEHDIELEATIQSGVTVEVYLIEVSDQLLAGVALELPTQPLVYSSSQSYDCGLVTIISDTATTGDRTTMLGIESDQFQVSDNVTALTVLDEQIQICGELFVCQNGGECLDDSLCVCPPNYSGVECETRIIQPPMLEIEASSARLEFGYQATCELTVDSQRNLEESVGSVEMQWLGPDGEAVNLTGVTVEGPTIMGSSASLSLNFSSLTTSHAGSYSCHATLEDEIPVVLEEQLNISFTLPAPTSVLVSQLQSGNATAGETITLLCTSVLATSITSPVSAVVEWTLYNGESEIPDTQRISVGATSLLTPTIFASMLNFSPLLESDTSSYTCRVYLTAESSEYLDPSDSASTSYSLLVDELLIPITLTPEPETVPSAPSYNTYSLTCEANPPNFLNYPFEFQWIRITGSDSQEIITPDSSTTIETSATEPVSILRTSQMIPGQYEYYCDVQFLYGDEVVASDTSISITVTVTGASNPAAPTDVNVYGTGVDFVVIQFTISHVEFTPETYYVEYTTESVTTLVQYPTINANFTTSNQKYTFVVDELQEGTAYGFKVVAVNSNGETRTDDYSFQTRTEEPYNTPDGETDFTYPLGAPIEWVFTFTDYSPDGSGLPIDGSGFVTIEFDFVPELHVPLQQPSVTATLGSEGISAVIEYSAASPSLTGSYVLCSRSDVPFLCGGRISLTVTVPSLSISTELLVAQYVNGTAVDNPPPQIVCLPSDIRAPVQWTTVAPILDPQNDFDVQFDPADLNHIIKFPTTYEQFPAVSVMFICDLINPDEADVEVDPVGTTVVFIQSPVALISNGRELVADAVINLFSVLGGVEYLSLRCVGTLGSGQLQWEAREVQRFSGVIGDSVLGSNDDITVDYYSTDMRDTQLVLQPIAQDTVGYYTCRSTTSGYEATVLTTFQNPYLAFTSQIQYDVPLGFKVDISARYAYSSNGYMNIGTGFLYYLTFLPYASLTEMPTGTSEPTIPQSQPVAAGTVDAFNNNYVYTLYTGANTAGQYNLTFQYTPTQEVYSQVTEILVIIPYVIDYEEDVVARRNQLVTLSCIPNDQRAPILWNLEVDLREAFDVRFLHDYPQYFTFDPPMLRHTVTFNTSIVSQFFPVRSDSLSFNCGFMDGNDDENIFNSTTVTVSLQDDTIQLNHAFTNVRIYNNTVINDLRPGEDGFTSPPPPQTKRGSPVEDSLYVDCMASQGDHLPEWITFNSLVGEASGVISEEDGYGAEMLSNYVARLYFEYFEPSFADKYTCISRSSEEFVEVFITTENPYVASVSPVELSVIEDSSVTLEFQIAVNSDGNTWDNEDVYFSFISGVDAEVSVPFSVRGPEFPQNYIYSIQQVDRSQEGQYFAFAPLYFSEEEEVRMAAINLTVTRRCPVEVNGGIRWQWTLEDTVVTRPCSEAGTTFRAGPLASRRCNKQGEWEEADLTTCTLAEVEKPFLLVWFVIEADEYTEDMKQGFIESMKMILDMNGVVYSRVNLQSAFIASVSITFQVELEEGDQSENITQLSTFLGSPEAFSTFSNYTVMEDGRGVVDVSIAETCQCSSANLGSSLQLCSGASISPCNCIDTVCMCQPPFVGDGLSCTLDSDSDGYPDQALDSPSCSADPSLTYCTADVCPEVSNPEQDPVECEPDATVMELFSGCPYGDDDVWGITWPNTPGGTTNSQPCPGGVDSVGTAIRVCYENGTWGEPDVLSCISLDILRVSMEAEIILPEADVEIAIVTPQLAQSAAVITEQLVLATETENIVSLLPIDLNTTNNVVEQVLNVLESSVESNVTISNEDLVEVFNNILNETHETGWQQLQTVGSGSQTLLRNAERYGAYLASRANNIDEPLVLVRENIIVSAQVANSSAASDIVFPANPDELANFTAVNMADAAQITIPAEAITKLADKDNTDGLAIVHIIFRNIEDFLPANTPIFSNSRSASLVISSQFGGAGQTDIPDYVFMENPITLNFSFTSERDVVNEYACVFWNFSDPVGRGGWASEGVQVVSNTTGVNLTTVLCKSTHFTSFAVLVDVAGGLEDVSREEQLALQIISYIGCIISTICLSITVVFYLMMGKKLFIAVHYFVHLNLALSLLLGYVVFMLGIELGTSSKGGCAFVAALLQYLFLSAFCWMMCEGVMLYLMLVVVFSKISKKWWFFLLLGWGIPLFFVVIGLAARADYYGVRGDDGDLAFCWLSTEKGTIFAFVAPMIAIIIINIVFLAFALVALRRSKKLKAKTVKKDNDIIKEAITILRATLILLPLLGVTWLFGLLTLNSNATVFAWLFTIFNSLQGAGVFFFHVVRNEKVWSKIAPRLTSLKRSTFKSSLKYDMSSSYSGGSTNTMKTLLHKKRPSENSYEIGTSSLTKESRLSSYASESKVEAYTDIDKVPLDASEAVERKPLDTIAEKEDGTGYANRQTEGVEEDVESGIRTGTGDEAVIHNPHTTDDCTDGDIRREETMM